MFKDKTILLLGGTGGIGRKVLAELIGLGPRVVRVFSRDDSKQALMREEYSDYPNVHFFIGDIRDAPRLLRAMENVDIVFHAAALKHVLASEYNPFECVKTNVVGTQNVIECAMDARPEKVIFTSTDKAVNPCNAMGTSKLMAERLMTAANYYKGPRKTVFASVRFGNVLGSRGSVVPIFRKQIAAGGPVTVTSNEMTRFVMANAQAVKLLFEACSLAQNGEVFVLKMPVLNIRDLAEVMIEQTGGGNIDIEEIGPKPGERIYEELITEDETSRTVEMENMCVVLPLVRRYLSNREFTYPGGAPTTRKAYRSDSEPLMSRREIAEMLNTAGLL